MDQQRRMLLGGGATALFATGPVVAARTALKVPVPPGRPGDFDFLEGTWKIINRRTRPDGEPDVFEGEAVCRSIMGGVGSVEDLRIPARKFAGMGLRLLDLEKRVWIDHWVNAKSGVLSLPGTSGGFVDGAGIFISEDTDAANPVIVKGVWDQITPDSCRWTQTLSRDGGRSWTEDWAMNWTRVSA